MLNLVCGASGVGKTAYIYDSALRALKDGAEVLLVVPDQEAVAAEEALSRLTQGIPSYKLQIYSFSRLCNAAFREYGGLSYAGVDKSTRNLAVFLALCSVSGELTEYSRVAAADSSLLSSLYASIREFKQYGVKRDDLDAFLSSKDPRISERLRRRLSDLRFISTAYDKVIETGFTDPSDDLTRLEKLLSEHSFFSGSELFIDSFVTYTPQQLKIIRRMLSGAENVTVSLCAPQHDAKTRRNPAFAPVYETEEKLLRLAADAGVKSNIISLETPYRYRSPELAGLEAGLRRGDVYGSESIGSVRVFACANAFEEADVIASDIQRRVRGGSSYGDIAVCARNVGSWLGILDAALEKYGIPFYISVHTDAREKAPLRLVQAALNVCVRGFRRQDVISYVKTGLLDVTDDDADLFEYYVTRRAINGKKFYSSDPWDESPDGFFALDEKGLEQLQTINATRYKIITPLYDLYVKLSAGGTTKELSVALFGFLESVGMRSIIAERAEKEGGAQAQEYRQLWNVISSAAENLVLFCGDMRLDAGQYSSLLDMIFSQSDIGTIPTSVDRVTFGEAGLMRTGGVLHVYVPGVNEGKFPCSVVEDGIFGDDEKKLLSEYGIQLSDTSEKSSMRELFDFYRTLSSPRESLTLTYAYSDLTGAQLRPSFALASVYDALPGLSAQRAPEWYERVQSKAAAFEQCAAHPDTPQGRALRSIFAADPEYSEKLAALDTPIASNDISLSESTADALFPGALRLSPSALDKFRKCQFSYCCSYILKLRESEVIEFKSNDFGTFIHYIMKRLMDDCTANPETIFVSDERLSQLTDGYMKGYISSQLGLDVDRQGNAKLRALFERMKKSVLVCARDALEELKCGDFKPILTEVAISDRNDPRAIPSLKLKLQDGRTVYLTGMIDRVDACEMNGKTYIKLVDYKSGHVDFRAEKLPELENAQLFLYALSVLDAGGKIENPEFAALYYMETTPPGTEMKASGSELEQSPMKRGGAALADPEVLGALEHGLTPAGGKRLKVNAGYMTIRPEDGLRELFDEVKAAASEEALKLRHGKVEATAKPGTDSPCKYCPYSPVCRRKALS